MDIITKNIVPIGLVIMLYVAFKNKRTKVESSSNTNPLFLILLVGFIYYLINYRKTAESNVKTNNNSSKSSKFYPGLSNLPGIQDKNLAHSLMGDSIDDYLNYFKQFNKPLVKDIKKQLKYFEKIQREIMEAEINTFLVQELDNLNLVKKEILQLAESLIYSIDIANVKTENIYHDFNEKLKDTLNSEYYSTKEQAKNKKKINIQNCRADIDIFSGVLVSDQEILPSNH